MNMDRRTFLFAASALVLFRKARPELIEEATVSAAATDVIPVGTITPFAGLSVPPGWLLCDGRKLDRVEYPKLYEVIGNAYGGNVPDYRGRVAYEYTPRTDAVREFGEAPFVIKAAA